MIVKGINYGKNNCTGKNHKRMDPAYEIRCTALVDPGTGGLVLPMAWKERLEVFVFGR